MGLSRRAYARRRGCSEAAVRKALKAGRIRLLPDGTIDPEEADRLWDANTLATSTAQTAGARNARTDPAPESPAVDYAAARARKELALAEKAELQVAELRGELVRRAAVNASATDVARAVRDRLRGIPGRLAQQLAAEDNPRLVSELLASEIDRALEVLTGELLESVEEGEEE